MKTGPLLLAATISVSACGESTSITDRATNDCHRLTLMDAETGLAIRGAEDLTLAPDGSFIVVSAYDRWWAEEAARGRWRTIPRGATYLIPVADELLSESQIVISALKTSSEDGLDFRPHGLDLHVSDDGSMTLAVINRRYVTRGDGSEPNWRIETTLEVFSIQDAALTHRMTVKSELLCRANNVVALSKNEFFVTRDHGACEGLGVMIEDTFSLARGKLIRVVIDSDEATVETVTVSAEGLAFPNGIAFDQARALIYVAATRDKTIQTFVLEDLRGDKLAIPESKMQLPASPDNLSMSASDQITVAAHPSLFRLGFYRKQWFGISDAPSQVFSVGLKSETITQLLDDPKGTLWSAATAAITIEDYLIAGSVADEGLLVCKFAPNAANQLDVS
jgi:arylesterase/paraoxonase